MCVYTHKYVCIYSCTYAYIYSRQLYNYDIIISSREKKKEGRGKWRRKEGKKYRREGGNKEGRDGGRKFKYLNGGIKSIQNSIK